ncbi:hypothetical protein O6H91_02G105600 [Diphasiastrum complanatum]|uniref:Uncharacterized protein n=2 Tax=Diphasiastrum complanatum TaxID=34168 RepID=A0ACC2EJ11_DIPCM|nr:hypothetical protein O6H91_02G105600 [Diphasiastrum complanatum]KAJ7566488.1 hypothetical protein O6H91_02G105600 [Diphasiastrum complanatum]
MAHRLLARPLLPSSPSTPTQHLLLASFSSIAWFSPSSSPAFGSALLKGLRSRRASGPRNSSVASLGSEASVREGFAVADAVGNARTEGADETQDQKHKDGRRLLVLYSKPGCCLCDELKQRLHTVFLMGGDTNLSDVHLEVRDITTNSEWEKAFQYEIPVLAWVKDNNSEEILPRFSPRLGLEQLQKKLGAALH